MPLTQGKPHCKSPTVGEKASKKIRLEKSNVEKILRQSALEKSPISVLKSPKTIVSGTIQVPGHPVEEGPRARDGRDLPRAHRPRLRVEDHVAVRTAAPDTTTALLSLPVLYVVP